MILSNLHTAKKTASMRKKGNTATQYYLKKKLLAVDQHWGVIWQSPKKQANSLYCF